MPIFYFHVCNGNGFVEDEEGTELADFAAARKQAISGLRDIMSSEMKEGEINLGSFVEIEDENHELVGTVPFIEAVHVTTVHGARPRR